MPKIVFDLQLANLAIQKINLRFASRSLCRAAALEHVRRTVQQLLLPVVDLVRVNRELARKLGDRPVPPDRCQRHLRLAYANCLIFEVQLKHRCAATRVYLSAEATKVYPARRNNVGREKALRHGSEE